MRNIFLFLIALFSIAVGYTQNSLNGKITSKKTNEPILATVYIVQLQKGVDSDFDGNYQLENIPNGNFEVIFSAMGFSTYTQKINFLNSEELSLNVELIESAVEMEEVIVSTPFHRLQRENVMKVEQLSMEKMNSMGNITLADGLKNVAGVNVISTGSGIGKPVIRGLSSNRVLTYTQGVRLENQQFGDEHGLGINESGIESIEVIKGPASLLYGSDALGGVLYINPEKFANPGELKADIGSTYFSNTLGSATNLGVKSSGEKFKYLIRGGYSSFSDYKTGGEYRVTNSRFNEKDLKAGIQFRDQKIKSEWRYNYNRSNLGIPDEISTQTSSKVLEIPFQEIDNHILSSDNTLYFDHSKIDLKLGYIFNDRREFEDDFKEADLQMKLNTFNYDLKYHLPHINNFETIVGLQGMFQKNLNAGEEILIPDAKTADIGIMATTHYHLEKIDLQGGLRFDNRKIDSESAREPNDTDYISPIKKSYTSFTLALGAKMDISENIYARLNFANGFRAPNLAELASRGVHEGTNRYEIGNQNLNTERNFQTDVSVEFQNEHLEISANGFYNLVNQYIFLSPSGEYINGMQVYHYLQQDAFLYGGEIGFHFHPHPMDWLHLESNFEMVIGKMKTQEYLPLIPAHSMNNVVRITFHDGKIRKSSSIHLGLENIFDQNKTGNFETGTGGYSLLNAGIQSSFQLEKIQLKLGITGTNLTNKKYISHLSRFKEEGLFDIGRSVNLNIKVSI